MNTLAAKKRKGRKDSGIHKNVSFVISVPFCRHLPA